MLAYNDAWMVILLSFVITAPAISCSANHERAAAEAGGAGTKVPERVEHRK